MSEILAPLFYPTDPGEDAWFKSNQAERKCSSLVDLVWFCHRGDAFGAEASTK